MAQPSPLTAEDRTAIVGLIASQNHLLDDWDIEGFVSNFVEDGVFDTVLGHCEGQHEIGATSNDLAPDLEPITGAAGIS